MSSPGSQGQFPLTQNVTVIEGETATLTCRVDQNDNTSLQWSNPAQQTLYFDDKKGEYIYILSSVDYLNNNNVTVK